MKRIELKDIIQIVDEMYACYPDIDPSSGILISPSNYQYLIASSYSKYENIFTFNSMNFVAMEIITKYHALSIAFALNIDSDDVVMHDLLGNELSYKEMVLNKIVEQMLLENSHG